jgi:hypothetical protein
MKDLHQKRIVRASSQRVQEQVPEGGMPFVCDIPQEIPQRRAGERNTPGLQLVAPHFVVQLRDEAQSEKQSGQHGRKLIRSDGS